MKAKKLAILFFCCSILWLFTACTPHEDIKVIIDYENETASVNRNVFGASMMPVIETGEEIKEFAKETGITFLRYPGGNSPGYHWKNQSLDFYYNLKYPSKCLLDIDDVFDFADDIGAEIVYQVNIESGTPEEAAELLKYLKNKNRTIRYWEIGNEAFGNWGAGNFNNRPYDYAELVKNYSKALKAIDKEIKIGADFGGTYYDTAGWDRTVTREAGDYFDFVSYHWYSGREGSGDPKNIMGNYFRIKEDAERFRQIINEEKPGRSGRIEIAYLEWDPVFENTVMRDTLTNAIAYADSLAYMILNNISIAAMFTFQEGDVRDNYGGFGLIPGIESDCHEWKYNPKWTGPKNATQRMWDGKIIKPKAYTFSLFSKHFGGTMVETEVIGSPSYKKSVGNLDFDYTGKVPYVSAYASKDESGLYLILTNKHPSAEYDVNIRIEGFYPEKESIVYTITGDSLISMNNYIPDSVTLTNKTFNNASDSFVFNLQPHSVVLIQFKEAEQ